MTFPSYATGTISIANGSTALSGAGTAWSTTIKPGDIVVHVPADAPQEIVGFALEVTGDLAITLADDFNGTTLEDAPYRIVRGIGWLAGAALSEILVQFLTELGPLGLAGVTSGKPTPETGRENELRIDLVARLAYFKHAGTWRQLTLVGSTVPKAGPWIGDPVAKFALAISTGDVAVDRDDGTLAEAEGAVPQFHLLIDGNFELQAPTNVEATQQFDVLFENDDTGGYDITAVAAYDAGLADLIRQAANARTRIRFTVDAASEGTGTAVSFAPVTFPADVQVEDRGFLYVSGRTDNDAEPQVDDGGDPFSTDDWQWQPAPTVAQVLDELGIHSITVSTEDPTGGADGDLWFKVQA